MAEKLGEEIYNYEMTAVEVTCGNIQFWDYIRWWRNGTAKR
jgi:hypothetical protein